jgi:hypothetical protein
VSFYISEQGTVHAIGYNITFSEVKGGDLCEIEVSDGETSAVRMGWTEARHLARLILKLSGDRA